MSIREKVDGEFKAFVIESNCTQCGKCAAVCPFEAIEIGDFAVVDPDLCDGCGECEKVCNDKAIYLPKDDAELAQLNKGKPVPRDFN